ncbi:MAG: isochorismatase family protein [Candidatus Taylorbacteria bacterium]|nr:isochorismatase family protein [Candidatus Taylorbacteria bacterium]
MKKLKAKQILLMGINANGCVQDTAMGAIKRGYKVITSLGIIANSKGNDLKLSSKNLKWYKENTRVFEDIEDMLNS